DAAWHPAPKGLRGGCVFASALLDSLRSLGAGCGCPSPRPRPSAGGGAGFGVTRRSQHADCTPGLPAFAITVPEISRTSRPDPSAIFNFTSFDGRFMIHEMTAAGGGFSPKNVWSPQNS